MSKFYTKLISGILTAAIGVTMLTLSVFAEDTNASKTNIWVAGDFHTHTNLSDGRYSAAAVAKKAFETYGLDWYSAADHGGGVKGTRFDDGSARKTVMPRWESIVGEGTDKVLANRLAYSQKLQFNGFEWNVPEHEHASVGMVGEDSTVRKMLSAFDYMYDGEKETENAVFKNFLDYHQANSKHDNAAQAASWLQAEFTKTSYILPNHVSRRLQFDIAALRDLNNAAPDVNFGFEGLPGHQKSSYRGGYAYISYYDKTAKKVFSYHIDQKDAYGSRLFFSAQDVVNKFIADADLANNAVKGTSNPAAVRDSAEAIIKAITLDTIQSQRTWGGADYMVAKVGGVWDAMLREGRKYFVFGNSDFHVNDVLKEGDEPDFWPGEYSKNYTAVTEKTYQGILDGMRSGKTYIVLGDLISDLDYSVTNDKRKQKWEKLLNVLKIKKL